jgi:hypothetical protein
VSLSKAVFLASAAGAAAAQCVALGLFGAWMVLPAPLLVAATWVAAWRGKRARLSSACFAAAVCLCAAGMLAGLSPSLMLAGCIASLGAWDAAALGRRTARAADASAVRRLEAAHMRRLVVIAGVSAALGASALLVRIRPGFGLLFLLGAALTVGLGSLVRSLGKD